MQVRRHRPAPRSLAVHDAGLVLVSATLLQLDGPPFHFEGKTWAFQGPFPLRNWRHA